MSTRTAGVMGWPVGHSLSPKLHRHWLSRYRIDGAYLPLAVRPEDLEQALKSLPLLGFRGCNVTVPHKESACRLVDRLDDQARRIGAVNTVVVGDDGSLAGTNTDAFGFIASLTDASPDWQPKDGPAVVLGAGGAARAVIVALHEAGAPVIRVANRTAERASALAADLSVPIEVVDWRERNESLSDATLLVNTTTLGMTGQPPLEMALDPLSIEALVTDIVYAPLETPLLAAARLHGNRVVDGLGMLLHQARPGFEAWFGVSPAVDDALRATVLSG